MKITNDSVKLMSLFLGNLWIAFICLGIADDGENESEIGDLAEALGTAGIIFFILSTITGLIIFLNQRKPFTEFFKKMKLKIKYIFKIHHPLTIIAISCWLIHGIVIFLAGSEDFGNSAVLIGWAGVISLGLLGITGILFPRIKGARIYLRYIHLILMFFAAIFLIIHAVLVD